MGRLKKGGARPMLALKVRQDVRARHRSAAEVSGEMKVRSHGQRGKK